jgi:peptide deformylase
MSKILLYGFNKSPPILINLIDPKGKDKNYANHLKNIAANYHVASLSSVQLNEKLAVFVMLETKYLVNNKWVAYKNAKKINYKAYNNPKIVDFSIETSAKWEECATYPGIKFLVKRSNKIKVEYYDEKYEKK